MNMGGHGQGHGDIYDSVHVRVYFRVLPCPCPCGVRGDVHFYVRVYVLILSCTTLNLFFPLNAYKIAVFLDSLSTVNAYFLPEK
jgi:hypothetical protein